jgi:hypothetical protein
MALDDGAADKQTNAHAITLSRVQRLEQSLRIPRMETHSGVSDGDAYFCAFVPLGPDQQVPRTILDIAHCLGGISQQVKNDLLELDSIASDTWKVAGELGSENHTVFLKFTRQQSNRFSYSVIQVQ